MDPFAQAHLSELLAAARMGPAAPSLDPDEQKTWTLVTFNAALTALKGVDAISDEEMAEWTNRMLVALREKPLEPLPPGAGVRLINFGGKRPQRPQHSPDPPPASRFLRLVPVDEPDRPWHMAVGSRSSEWSSTATRSPSTGDSHRYLIQRHFSPPSWLNKTPTSRAFRMTSRRSFGTSSSNGFRCRGARSLSPMTWVLSSEGPVAARVEAAMKGGETRTSFPGHQQRRNG
jgi:hypothetical protein